jgi:hypothetical protein
LLKPSFHPNNSDSAYPQVPAKTGIANNQLPIIPITKIILIFHQNEEMS